MQITLGGEAVDQDLLDRLHAAFPHARLTHIYASTEMGVCFSVRDGKAGFPADYLSDRSLPCQLRIASDGELEIRSKRAMVGYFIEPDDARVLIRKLPHPIPGLPRAIWLNDAASACTLSAENRKPSMSAVARSIRPTWNN